MDYRSDSRASGSEEDSGRITNWMRTSPASDFLAYAEEVKNGEGDNYAPWDGRSFTGYAGANRSMPGRGRSKPSDPANLLDNPLFPGSIIPGTTMDIFGRRLINEKLPETPNGQAKLIAGMLSDGTPFSVSEPSPPKTVLDYAAEITGQMTKDSLRSDFFWENGWHSQTYGGNFLSCGDQVDFIKPRKEKRFPDWKFEVDAGPLHTVLIAIPPDGRGPRLKIDPWYGSFAVIPE